MQLPAADGDRSLLLEARSVQQQHACTALSLKARETASLSLKRIFEQHARSCSGVEAAAPRSSSAALDHLQNNHEYRDQHSTLDVDLDLKLGSAAPASASVPNYPPLQHAQTFTPFADVDNAATAKPSHLTVFYAGTVCVFEDVPADKAKAILVLAAGSARDQSTSKAYSTCGNAVCKSRPTTPDIVLSKPLKSRARSQAELPFARKASLARFLERRKDRVEAEVKSTKDGENSREPSPKRLCTKPSTIL